MSRNDYTKYARENKVEIPETPVEVKSEPEVEEILVDLVPVVEPVVEETKVADPEVTDEPEVETTRKIGRVFGCSRLNVRRMPKPRAEVICEINCDSEVEVDEDNSTIDFYKVTTASGIEGYCVKTYINVIK